MNAEDFSAARGLGTIDPNRVRFIPGIGVDAATYRPLPGQREAIRRELSLAPDAFVLVMIAEMNANKRHELVLEAMAATRDPRVTLLLVGTGELEPALRQRAASLGIADRVRFLGQRSDVPALLAASDALVLASVREGMPRVVLEAMGTGIPVIATPTRGVIDAVDGPTGDAAGWLVAPTADDLARAIGDAAADPDEAARRGAIGRGRIDRTYALPLIVAAYRELYDEALA
jgi:glycosyltransferase involved in cell wall biosynthesis